MGAAYSTHVGEEKCTQFRRDKTFRMIAKSATLSGSWSAVSSPDRLQTTVGRSHRSSGEDRAETGLPAVNRRLHTAFLVRIP
jgi:hypothetical protein